jgi:hypothetical protein
LRRTAQFHFVAQMGRNKNAPRAKAGLTRLEEIGESGRRQYPAGRKALSRNSLSRLAIGAPYPTEPQYQAGTRNQSPCVKALAPHQLAGLCTGAFLVESGRR